ncbi:MAG: hypothetical protein ACPGOY_09125 [Rhodospirillaceae bacterium]
MSEDKTPPDMGALAARYMDLWQQQVSSMASDPKLAEAMSKTMAFMADAARNAAANGPPGGAMGGGMAGPMGFGMPGMGGHDPASQASAGANPAAGSETPGSETPGPASGAAGGVDAGLADRVAELEHRVTVLESALGTLLSALQPDQPASDG